jgi:hypothetical protein
MRPVLLLLIIASSLTAQEPLQQASEGRLRLKIPDSLKNNSAICNFIQRYNTLPADQNPCSARSVEELLDLAREWSAHFGRPIHLGEFGSHDANNPTSRSRYAHDVRVLAETRHIPWALWDWKATFSYWDSAKNEARFRSVLFG